MPLLNGDSVTARCSQLVSSSGRKPAWALPRFWEGPTRKLAHREGANLSDAAGANCRQPPGD